MSERDVSDFITAEVSRFLSEDSLGFINSVSKELILLMEKWFMVLLANLVTNQLMTWEFTFKEFDGCGAPCFFGKREPITNVCWIADVESSFALALFR